MQINQPSLIALENAHLHALNQQSIVKMRPPNQEEPNNQQLAEEQQTYVNEANAQLVLTEASLRRKWEAEPDDEERERQKNDFFHARSFRSAHHNGGPWTGRSAYQRCRASYRCGPAGKSRERIRAPHWQKHMQKTPRGVVTTSGRTSMIDEFLESKREKTPPPRRKPAKKSRQQQKRQQRGRPCDGAGVDGRSGNDSRRRNVFCAPKRRRGAQLRDTAARRRLFRIRDGGIESSLQRQ